MRFVGPMTAVTKRVRRGQNQTGYLHAIKHSNSLFADSGPSLKDVSGSGGELFLP